MEKKPDSLVARVSGFLALRGLLAFIGFCPIMMLWLGLSNKFERMSSEWETWHYDMLPYYWTAASIVGLVFAAFPQVFLALGERISNPKRAHQ